jgi:hypothetical protein
VGLAVVTVCPKTKTKPTVGKVFVIKLTIILLVRRMAVENAVFLTIVSRKKNAMAEIINGGKNVVNETKVAH